MVVVNLIPEPILLAHMRRRRIKRWIGAGVVALIVAAMPVGLEGWRRTQAEELRQHHEILGEEVEALRSDLSTIMATSTETLVQIQRAKALRAKRAWSAMVSLVASSLPPRCWLISLATDPDVPAVGSSRLAPTAAELSKDKSNKSHRTVTIEAPRALRLAGYAREPNEPLDFVSTLKNTGIFKRVDLEKSVREPVEDGFYFRFEVVCEW